MPKACSWSIGSWYLKFFCSTCWGRTWLFLSSLSSNLSNSSKLSLRKLILSIYWGWIISGALAICLGSTILPIGEILRYISGLLDLCLLSMKLLSPVRFWLELCGFVPLKLPPRPVPVIFWVWFPKSSWFELERFSKVVYIFVGLGLVLFYCWLFYPIPAVLSIWGLKKLFCLTTLGF